MLLPLAVAAAQMWKEELIEAMEERTGAAPVGLPTDVDSVRDLDYQVWVLWGGCAARFGEWAGRSPGCVRVCVCVCVCVPTPAQQRNPPDVPFWGDVSAGPARAR